MARDPRSGRADWYSENAEGLVGFVSVGPTRDNDNDNDTDIPLQLFARSVRAGYRGTGVGYALFEQAVGDRREIPADAREQRAGDLVLQAAGVPAWTGGSTSTTRDSTRGWCGAGRRHPDHGHGAGHAALGVSAGH